MVILFRFQIKEGRLIKDELRRNCHRTVFFLVHGQHLSERKKGKTHQPSHLPAYTSVFWWFISGKTAWILLLGCWQV